jgi:hypothetical protein
MDYFLDNWGSFVGLLSLIVTIIGFGVAIHRATQARKSAAAAEAASQETRKAVTKVLTLVDLQRAIALIQRLKALHRDNKWDACLGHYPDLRAMLADIDASHPAPTPGVHTTLRESILQLKVIEDSVDRALNDGTDPSGARNFNEVLNTIQVSLEEMASFTYFAGSEADR